VLAFHLSILLGDKRFLGHQVFQDWTWRMSLGVDFFFVLSGFIILKVHYQDVGRPHSAIS
jgi:peptidoglycan/LPS O-acetylase OafA/YrhL